mgnify:CR=1 FL=1
MTAQIIIIQVLGSKNMCTTHHWGLLHGNLTDKIIVCSALKYLPDRYLIRILSVNVLYNE